MARYIDVTVAAATLTLTLLAATVSAGQATGGQIGGRAGDVGSRPYQSVFGGSAVDPTVRHSLDLSFTGFGADEQNALEDTQGDPVAPDGDVQSTGAYTGFSTGLNYGWRGRRLQVGANAGTDGRYVFSNSQYVSLGYYSAIGVSAQFDQRTHLFVNQSVALTPAYTYGLFPQLGSGQPGTAVGTGTALGDGLVNVYDTEASFTRGITARSSVQAAASLRYSRFDSDDGNNEDLKSYSVGANYEYGLTRGAALQLGYAYNKGLYGVPGNPRSDNVVHNINVGVNYGKALSFSRRTKLDFEVGSAIVNTQDSFGSGQNFRYRLLADVGLGHQMGRSWLARLAYNRGIAYTEGFTAPVFNDAMNASVGGFISRRLEFTAQGGFSIGNPASDSLSDAGSSNDGYRALTALARLKYGLSRNWALFAEYNYYRHNVEDADLVAETYPPVYGQNAVRAGLTFWVPVLRK